MTEELLRERMERLGAGPSNADWRDACSRGIRLRRKRRVLAAGIAAAAMLAVAATPAFGLGQTIIDFFQAEPAPEVVKRNFADFNAGAPPGMEQGVVARDARAVITRNLSAGRFTLWVAPTHRGGWCLSLGRSGHGLASTCDREGRLGLAPGGARGGEGTRWLQFGAVKVDHATYVEIELDDRTSVQTQLVWVSDPIDAGFFLTELPLGREARAFFARDQDGAEVARLIRPTARGPH